MVKLYCVPRSPTHYMCGTLAVGDGLCIPHIAPLFGNPLFPPEMQPERFGWWLNKGLYRIGDYLNYRGICPPSYFTGSLEMTPAESLHLQQIYHFVNSLRKEGSDLGVQTMFENRCIQDAAMRGDISMLYKLLADSTARLSY